MTTPDFVRIAKAAAPVVQKDNKHSLIIFSVLGFASIIWNLMNDNSLEFHVIGAFLLTLGVALFLVGKKKKPFLMNAIVKKIEAVPYKRIPGQFDYFTQVEVIGYYAFSTSGQSVNIDVETNQRFSVSVDIVHKLSENKEANFLFSSTKTLLGVFTEDYELTSY